MTGEPQPKALHFFSYGYKPSLSWFFTFHFPGFPFVASDLFFFFFFVESLAPRAVPSIRVLKKFL